MNHRDCVFAFLLFSISAHGTELMTARVTHVTDGDTLWVQPDSGGSPLKLRLEGIDAPEICQTGGEASRNALSTLTIHRTLTVSTRSYDDYGRGLARLIYQGQDVGAEMVRSGQAWSYRWRNSLGPYALEEQAARHDRKGLFSQAGAQLPREFRQQHGSCFPRKP
ncbi:thermonuclease family protein [Rhodoferax sp. PAMC 29310]|uniref:thermonuclease family protein n=1 Tax=Rhodoferax sp. PAMC 29310 TaxID=2822760 RepID=UPI001F0B4B8F|nr:thermonuclease family protein [Rhodoferax sp. PAMC 29310]